MSASHLAIVFFTDTGHIRLFRVPADDSELFILDDPSLNYPGCTRVKVKRADYNSLFGNKPPQNAREIDTIIEPGSVIVTAPLAV